MLNLLQFASIMLAAVTAGMFLGPWAALTRTIDRLEPAAFLPLLHQLSPNMSRLMTILLPLSLLLLLVVTVLTLGLGATFYAYLATSALFLIALLVTTAIEVPLVKRMEGWNISTMPADWTSVRDRWMSFHLLRVGCGLLGLATLVAAAVFFNCAGLAAS